MEIQEYFFVSYVILYYFPIIYTVLHKGTLNYLHDKCITISAMILCPKNLCSKLAVSAIIQQQNTSVRWTVPFYQKNGSVLFKPFYYLVYFLLNCFPSSTSLYEIESHCHRIALPSNRIAIVSGKVSNVSSLRVEISSQFEKEMRNDRKILFTSVCS